MACEQPGRNAAAPSFGLTGPACLPISASIEAPRYGGAFASGRPRRGRVDLLQWSPGECPERQRGRTVNPLAYAFVGSSPTSPTTTLLSVAIHLNSDALARRRSAGPIGQAMGRPRACSGRSTRLSRSARAQSRSTRRLRRRPPAPFDRAGEARPMTPEINGTGDEPGRRQRTRKVHPEAARRARVCAKISCAPTRPDYRVDHAPETRRYDCGEEDESGAAVVALEAHERRRLEANCMRVPCMPRSVRSRER